MSHLILGTMVLIQVLGGFVKVDAPETCRKALVIGNEKYPEGQELLSILDETRIVEASLRAAGFDVQVERNLGDQEFRETVSRFAAGIRAGDAALIYYSGHGHEFEGRSYLVPVDFGGGGQTDVARGIPIEVLIDALDGTRANPKLLFLDMSRTAIDQTGADASDAPGLQRSLGLKADWFIGFSTGPGEAAWSGPVVSPFALAMSILVLEADLELGKLYRRLNGIVHRLSGEKQRPWSNSTMIDDFFFSPSDPSRYCEKRPQGAIVLVNMKRENKVSDADRLIESALHRLAPEATIRIVHWTEISPLWLADEFPKALILGPQGTPWWDYDQAALQPIKDAVVSWDGPLLGICGGHQFLALALGSEVAPMHCEAGSKGYKGCAREKGFTEVRLLADDPLLDGLEGTIKVWENHVEEVKKIPPGFQLLASSAACPIQAVRRRGTLSYGVQFHPEQDDEGHGDGLVLLENFLEIAGVVKRPEPSPKFQR
ncbi:MAG: caspase family protein [Pseudomonadota bacterium]